MDILSKADSKNVQIDFEEFFEDSLCGFLIADNDQKIIRANLKILEWLGPSSEELLNKKLSDILSIGSKIYYETNLSPLLRLQGFFEEVVLEIARSNGEKLKVLVNVKERKDDNGKPLFFTYTFVKATDRILYEQSLLLEKRAAEKEALLQSESVMLREQLIAVLGHDLRNPLAAVNMATQILKSTMLGADEVELMLILERSTRRMTELVGNIMDFARTRLGDGIILERTEVDMNGLLKQLVKELQISHPQNKINLIGNLSETIYCDASRLSQLVSNLISNALVHGSGEHPVLVNTTLEKNIFVIAVSNQGEVIPAEVQDSLFVPFAREVNQRAGKGLGLGLYIAFEIARAHNGTLSFISNEQGTCFTFSMPTTQ